MNVANFGPVAEGADVYGACRPGHLGGDLNAWTDVLRWAGVDTVVCLLSEAEAARWRLPDAYCDTFDVAHVPVRDRHLPDAETLRRAVDILATARADGRPAAIHCNAGQGRTGVVGAAWLVYERGLAPERAVEAVEAAPVPRSPREAVRADNATAGELLSLLDRV